MKESAWKKSVTFKNGQHVPASLIWVAHITRYNEGQVKERTEMYASYHLLDIRKHPCLHAELDCASDTSAQNLYEGSVKHKKYLQFLTSYLGKEHRARRDLHVTEKGKTSNADPRIHCMTHCPSLKSEEKVSAKNHPQLRFTGHYWEKNGTYLAS